MALAKHSTPLTAQSIPKAPNIATFNEQDIGRQCRHRHSIEEWETIKDYFTLIYLQEGNTLEDARREMKFKYKFEARQGGFLMIAPSLVLLCTYVTENTPIPVSVNTRKWLRNGAWKTISKQQIYGVLPKRGTSAPAKEVSKQHSWSGGSR